MAVRKRIGLKTLHMPQLFRLMRMAVYLLMLTASSFGLLLHQESAFSAETATPSSLAGDGPIVVATVDGTINPASDDYLRTSLQKAVEQRARLFVLKLNTPGGLLTSMQTMVAQLLESRIPTVVYVSPAGGGAISAGVFITMAGHVAVMAPGTTIGAAHPVSGGGQDVKGHMGEKVENFTVSLARAIAEQRGRNADWAEKAVRESVAITDREAVDEKVVDFIASDLNSILQKLEGKTIQLKSSSVTLSELAQAPRVEIEWSFKQTLINILSDPNIAILLGLGALAGIGIELYNPGLIVPGVVGAVCLILSLTAGQVLPIAQGGVALLLLGCVLFAVEFFVPAFGIWGVAGIICIVLGSIYFIDTDMVWSTPEFAVNRGLVGSLAALVGVSLVLIGGQSVRAQKSPVSTGREGMLGRRVRVRTPFKPHSNPDRAEDGWYEGRVFAMGELWRAEMRLESSAELPEKGEELLVTRIDGLLMQVERP